MSQLITGQIADLPIVHDTGPVATIYISLDHQSPDAREANRIRFKNARQALEAIVEKDKLLAREIGGRFLELVDTVLEDEGWDLGGASLTIALYGDRISKRYLYRKVDDRVVIGEQPFILPSLRASPEFQPFAILDMNQDHAELLVVSESSSSWRTISQRGVEGYPPDEEDRSDQLQFHNAGRDGSHQQGVFHGQGQDEHAAEERMRRWVKDVAESVTSELHNTELPVVFAGNERLFGLFKENIDYSGFIDDYCATPRDLDEKREATIDEVRKIIHKRLEHDLVEIKAKVMSAIAHDFGETDLSKIAKSAEEGQIDILLISNTLDESAGGHALRIGATKDELKLNRAACLAMQMGARVVVVPPDLMPDSADKAASAYRF